MYVGRMKLTRNKIRKIRKQQHQSVRKWKRARKSPRRKAMTFRRSRSPLVEMDNIAPSPGYPLKLNNVFNKTLKRYIPLPVLSYMKDKYDKMKRLRRKQRREKMIGGGKNAAAAAVAVAAASAAAAAVGAAKSTIITDNNNNTVADKDAPAPTDGEKKPGFNLGPEIEGDISIHSESFVLEKKGDAQKLLTFLVKNCLPYYIQLELKPGKQFNKHDTGIFDLRRILYGKFATKKDFETDGKIADKKHGMYFNAPEQVEAPEQVGIADGDTMGNDHPNDVFIYT